MSEKSRSISMILSFLFTGVGIVYLGNIKKGVGLFAIGVLFNLLGMFVFGFFHYMSILTWIVSLYLTYIEPIATAGSFNNNHSMANRQINRGYNHNRYHNENAMGNRHVNRRHDVNRYPNDGRHFDDRVFEDNRYPNDGRHFDDRVFEDNRYPNDDRIFDDRVRENNGYHNRLHEDRSFDAGHSHERPVRQSGNRKHAHIDYEGMSYGDEVYNERLVERKNPENNFHETNDDILSRRRINRK